MRPEENGPEFEKFIETLLQKAGYVEEGDKKKLLRMGQYKDVKGKFYAKQVEVGITRVGNKRRVDFFLVNHDNPAFPHGVLIIEGKWQQSGGSTDTKLRPLPDDIDDGGILTLVILDGRGYSPGIEEELRRRAKTDPFFLAVWGMTEARIQTNNGFFGTGVITKVRSSKPSQKIMQLPGLWVSPQGVLS